MLRRQTPLKTICAVLMIFAGSIALSLTAEAKSCKGWAFVGLGSAATQNQGKAKARANWKIKVKDYWGFQWSNWSLAKLKWQRCERRGRGYFCKAHGVPCTVAGGFKQR